MTVKNSTVENSPEVLSDSTVAIPDSDYEGASIRAEIANLANGRAIVYTSIKGNDFGAKVTVVEALSNSLPIADNLDKVINVKDIIVQPVSYLDRTTGEVVELARTVLLDVDGTAYHAMSAGLYLSVKNIVQILGDPANWPGPLPIKVRQMKAKTGHYFTARIVRPGS